MKTVSSELTVSLVITSMISILLGVFYFLDMFSFNFLGIEAGSQQEVVNFWGIISSGIGVIALISCLSLKFGNIRIIKEMLIGLLILHLIIQVPPLILWSTVGLSGQIQELVFSVGLHMILAVMIIRTLIAATR